MQNRPTGLQSIVTRASSSAGQGLAEYALILALIAIIAILALLFLGSSISNLLSQVGTNV